MGAAGGALQQVQVFMRLSSYAWGHDLEGSHLGGCKRGVSAAGLAWEITSHVWSWGSHEKINYNLYVNRSCFFLLHAPVSKQMALEKNGSR